MRLKCISSLLLILALQAPGVFGMEAASKQIPSLKKQAAVALLRQNPSLQSTLDKIDTYRTQNNVSIVDSLKRECIAQYPLFDFKTPKKLLSLMPSYALLLAAKRVEAIQKPHEYAAEVHYRSSFQIATRPLYHSFTHLPGNVIVVVRNAEDGFGDHAHGVAVCNEILAHFPQVTLSYHGFFEQRLKDLPFLAKPAEGCSNHSHSVWNKDLPEVENQLGAAACILQVSYQDEIKPIHSRLRELKRKPAYSFLGEYGETHKNNRHIDPEHLLNMGLHSDNEGIFFKEIPFTPLHQLTDKTLCQLLFNTHAPTKEISEKYLQQNHLHIFYHKMSCFYNVSDLYICAEYHQNDEKPIDILMSLAYDMQWLIDYNVLNLDVLKKFGIKQVRYIKKGIIDKIIPIGSTGKEMRIIHPGFLEQKDFYTLMANCEEPIGCTGDQSLSDGFSLKDANGSWMDKVLYYELRCLKKTLFSAWRNLAKKLGCHLVDEYLATTKTVLDDGSEYALENFKGGHIPNETHLELFKQMAPKMESAAHRIAQLLRNPEFKNQWKTVNAILRQYHDVRPHIRDIVARHLVFHHFPEAYVFESKLYEEFRRGKKNLEQAHHELKLFLEHIKK